ncbi:hypothetical protein [Planococcus sp. ISL-110]|uniref:hypothetical protein n=1 Tax=Planococcus sp. ISL-110 TaxID=2819167 RepID=UPI001BE91F5A|nr:hypothetical protein [Planococcus sp. ISL-110]MBT2572328.1 hypothetical protein [Planococcus sp. ISL-110]
MKKTIFVHDISSIKHNHFSFKDNLGVIKDYPFVLKTAPDGSAYHFDKNDLVEMSHYEKDLAPHDDSSKLSRKGFINEMKKEFYHQIRSGNMDDILTHLYKLEGESIELKWGGHTDHDFKI